MNGKHIASAVLLLCLALSAFRASADGAFAIGSNAGFDDITGAANDPLASVTVSKPAASTASGTFWHCAVTCSVEFIDDGAAGTATLRITNGATVAGSERTFEMVGLSPMEVSTTAITSVNIPPGIAALLACGANEGTGDVDVADSSITVVCTDLP